MVNELGYFGEGLLEVLVGGKFGEMVVGNGKGGRWKLQSESVPSLRSWNGNSECHIMRSRM